MLLGLHPLKRCLGDFLSALFLRTYGECWSRVHGYRRFDPCLVRKGESLTDFVALFREPETGEHKQKFHQFKVDGLRFTVFWGECRKDYITNRAKWSVMTPAVATPCSIVFPLLSPLFLLLAGVNACEDYISSGNRASSGEVGCELRTQDRKTGRQWIITDRP